MEPVLNCVIFILRRPKPRVKRTSITIRTACISLRRPLHNLIVERHSLLYRRGLTTVWRRGEWESERATDYRAGGLVTTGRLFSFLVGL